MAKTKVRVPAQGTALLLIDVINDMAFPGSAPLVEQAEAMALKLARLKRRAARAGVPVIYVNDNFGNGGPTSAAPSLTALPHPRRGAWLRRE